MGIDDHRGIRLVSPQHAIDRGLIRRQVRAVHGELRVAGREASGVQKLVGLPQSHGEGHAGIRDDSS